MDGVHLSLYGCLGEGPSVLLGPGLGFPTHLSQAHVGRGVWFDREWVCNQHMDGKGTIAQAQHLAHPPKLVYPEGSRGR